MKILVADWRRREEGIEWHLALLKDYEGLFLTLCSGATPEVIGDHMQCRNLNGVNRIQGTHLSPYYYLLLLFAPITITITSPLVLIFLAWFYTLNLEPLMVTVGFPKAPLISKMHGLPLIHHDHYCKFTQGQHSGLMIVEHPNISIEIIKVPPFALD